jgi:acyl carrier protein
MMTLIVYLEKSFRIDFAEVDFEVGLIDSVNEIASFVDAHLAR